VQPLTTGRKVIRLQKAWRISTRSAQYLPIRYLTGCLLPVHRRLRVLKFTSSAQVSNCLGPRMDWEYARKNSLERLEIHRCLVDVGKGKQDDSAPGASNLLSTLSPADRHSMSPYIDSNTNVDKCHLAGPLFPPSLLPPLSCSFSDLGCRKRFHTRSQNGQTSEMSNVAAPTISSGGMILQFYKSTIRI
jgi:hypothetical protein